MRRSSSLCAAEPDLFQQGVSHRIVEEKRVTLAAQHQADIERLRPIVMELAHRAGSAGITAGDIRMVAERRGLLEHGHGRSLSWLTSLPKACGLVSTGKRRMSPIPRSRNDHVIYVLPELRRMQEAG